MNEEVEDPEKTVGLGEVPVARAEVEVDAERPAIVEPGPISGSSKDVDVRQLKRRNRKGEYSYHRRPSTC